MADAPTELDTALAELQKATDLLVRSLRHETSGGVQTTGKPTVQSPGPATIDGNTQTDPVVGGGPQIDTSIPEMEVKKSDAPGHVGLLHRAVGFLKSLWDRVTH